MDPKELRGLMEAYAEVYAPQEVDELYKGKHGQSETEYMDSRSDAGKQISGTSKLSGAAYSHRSYKGVGSPAKPGERQKNQGKMTPADRNELAIRKANLKKEELEQVGEAVKGASRHDTEMRKAAASERRSGIKPLPAKEGEKYAKYKMAQMDYAKRKRMGEEVSVFDVVLEFLQAEGFAETLEEAEWMMANVIDEEAIDIILGEEITSEKGKAKAAEMIAKRTTASGRAKSGQGDNVAAIKHIQRSNRDGLGGTPPNRKVAGSNWPKSYSGIGGTGNKAARRAAALKNEEYVDEAQEARNNPEKYEAGEKKKYAPVRGERTPMPPRGDKRREDFEKWYAANVR